MVLDGQVDGSAIDSTVLEWLIGERAELSGEIRVIDSKRDRARFRRG
jgi:hypothetical protein